MRREWKCMRRGILFTEMLSVGSVEYNQFTQSSSASRDRAEYHRFFSL